MCEHEVLGRERLGEIDQLFAVGVARQVEALDLGAEDGRVVEAGELELTAGGHADQFAPGRFRIAVAHEEHGVFLMVEHVGGDAPGGRLLDQHAAREQVDAAFREVFTGLDVAAGKREYVEVAQDLPVELHLLRLLGGGVEVIAEIHPEARSDDGHIGEVAGGGGLIEQHQDFLHAPESESRKQHGTTGVTDAVDGFDESLLFHGPGVARVGGGRTAGTLHDQRIDWLAREVRPADRPLGLEIDVPGEEVAFAAVLNHTAHGARDVAGEVEAQLNLFAAAADLARVGERDRREGVFDPFHILVDVQREVEVAGLLALALHHLDRVGQQAAGKERRRGRSEDPGAWVGADQQG